MAAVATAAPVFNAVSGGRSNGFICDKKLIQLQATETALVEKRQDSYITNFLCAHDHLRSNEKCNAKKKANGDKGFLIDLLGLSLA